MQRGSLTEAVTRYIARKYGSHCTLCPYATQTRSRTRRYLFPGELLPTTDYNGYILTSGYFAVPQPVFSSRLLKKC
jgi:hypothetical protein